MSDAGLTDTGAVISGLDAYRAVIYIVNKISWGLEPPSIHLSTLPSEMELNAYNESGDRAVYEEWNELGVPNLTNRQAMRFKLRVNSFLKKGDGQTSSRFDGSCATLPKH